MNHQEAKALVDGLGLAPLDSLLVRAIAYLETSYGAWKGSGEGSNNWGAIQATAAWDGPAFVATDTHADGTPYAATFRYYSSPEEGTADLWKVLQSKRYARALELARSGNWGNLSSALHSAGYFEQAPSKHAARLRQVVSEIVAATGEPSPEFRSGSGVGFFVVGAAVLGYFLTRKGN